MTSLSPTSILRGRTRRGCTTTTSAARTISPPTARSPTPRSRTGRPGGSGCGRTARFLGRAVRYLAGEAGVRQFLDIGSGLPTTANVHEIAQAADPSSRVVYVDNDPMVLVHARALLTSAPEGRTAYIQADLRSPLDILYSPVVRSVLDFSQPVALMLVAVLHFLGRRTSRRRSCQDPARRPAAGFLPGRVARDAGARPGRGRRRAARLPQGGAADAHAGRGRVRVARVLRPGARAARGGARLGMAAGLAARRGRPRPRCRSTAGSPASRDRYPRPASPGTERVCPPIAVIRVMARLSGPASGGSLGAPGHSQRPTWSSGPRGRPRIPRFLLLPAHAVGGHGCGPRADQGLGRPC